MANDNFLHDESGLSNLIGDVNDEISAYIEGVDALEGFVNDIESSSSWLDEDVKTNYIAAVRSFISSYRDYSAGLEAYMQCLDKKNNNLIEHEKNFSQKQGDEMSYSTYISSIDKTIASFESVKSEIEGLGLDSLWQGNAATKQIGNLDIISTALEAQITAMKNLSSTMSKIDNYESILDTIARNVETRNNLDTKASNYNEKYQEFTNVINEFFIELVNTFMNFLFEYSSSNSKICGLFCILKFLMNSINLILKKTMCLTFRMQFSLSRTTKASILPR